MYLIIENSSRPLNAAIRQFIGLHRLPFLEKVFGLLITFCLTCYAWIFFRANNVDDAWYITTHLFSNLIESVHQAKPSSLGTTFYDWFVGLGCLLILLMLEYIQGRVAIRPWLKRQSTPVQISLYLALTMLILLFGVFDVQEQFIYFQF